MGGLLFVRFVMVAVCVGGLGRFEVLVSMCFRCARIVVERIRLNCLIGVSVEGEGAKSSWRNQFYHSRGARDRLSKRELPSHETMKPTNALLARSVWKGSANPFLLNDRNSIELISIPSAGPNIVP